MRTITELWAAAESGAGDRLALLGDESLTYAQLGTRIRGTAAALASDWTLRPGDVVALLAPNGAAFVTGYFAAQNLGAVVLPLDERLTDEELAGLLAHSGAAGLLAAPSLSARATRLCSNTTPCIPVRLLDASLEPGADAALPQGSGPARPAGAPAELLYTSGTSGMPKGVIRSHANVLAAVRNARLGFGYEPRDTIAIVMPLSHSSALTSQLLPVLQLGGRVALLPRFDAAALIGTIATERVTCVRLVPAMIRLLLAQPRFDSASLPSLRLVVNSSAPVDPDTYRDLKRRFANIAVLNSYGLTEASTCTVLPDHLALTHADSVGAAVDGVRLSIRAEDGSEAAPEEAGEIWIAGDHVFAGYHRDPAATAAARSGEWLRTGDLGTVDRDGLLYLHGRRDDLINCGGRKVAPEAVERCLAGAPGVREVACTAMPHRVLGQVVHAFVVADDPASFDSRAAVRYCSGLLPSHMVPFRVTVVPGLPRNAVGKLVRRRLPTAV